ncbi:MAG: hypothetical protein GX145_04245 [Clostridiaceae bacterium]|jgi:hypothetical protein|nr:hypothetical protein [Bacillota bacterium]NLN52003.1 hypothetical protein [Clostridiaceae bacterium]
MLNELKVMLKETQNSEGPKISIYLPTSRMLPESQQDAIAFKNLIQDVQLQLQEKYNRRVWEPIISKLDQLQRDSLFWSHSKDGLAVFADEKIFETFRVPQSFEQKAIVQNNFFIAPLLDITIIQGDYLIDLSKDRLKIYEIEGTKARVLEQDQIKTSFPDLFDDFDSNSNVNFGSYKGKTKSTFHGHRARPEEQEKDRQKYFHYIDQQLTKLVKVNEPHVILAGTADTVSQFQHVARGKFYFEKTIEKPFEALNHKEQEQAVTDILKPYIKSLEEAEINNYGFQKSRDKVVFEPEKILEYAEQGQVAQIIISKKYSAKAEEKMNEIIAKAIQTDATVHLADEDRFKDRLAAVLRF